MCIYHLCATVAHLLSQGMKLRSLGPRSEIFVTRVATGGMAHSAGVRLGSKIAALGAQPVGNSRHQLALPGTNLPWIHLLLLTEWAV